MAVSKRLRFEILRRDNHACRYCGVTAESGALTIDHVVPVALGGQDVPENLVAACRDCNAGKSSAAADAELVADVAEDALRWRKAMEVAQELADKERQSQAIYLDAFREEWSKWTYTVPSYRSGTGKEEKHAMPVPADWETSLAALCCAGGIGVLDIVESVRIAMSAKCDNEFRYFMGVLRNRSAARQAVAREVLRQGLV